MSSQTFAFPAEQKTNNADPQIILIIGFGLQQQLLIS